MFKHKMYANLDSPDSNGNWWYFYFDNGSKLWKFWYSGTKPQPGDNIFGEILSEYDPTALGKQKFLHQPSNQKIFEGYEDSDSINQVENCKFYINWDTF